MVPQSFKRSKYSFVDYGTFLVNRFENYLSKMKEDIFKILKDFEAFSIGHIIMQEGDLEFDELFIVVSKSFKKLCREHNIDFPTFTKELLLLNIPFGKDYVHFLIEVCVNVGRGLEAIRLNACKKANIDSDFVYTLTGMFKKLFCLEYYNRHHK